VTELSQSNPKAAVGPGVCAAAGVNAPAVYS
jgi:hypothetical protein